MSLKSHFLHKLWKLKGTFFLIIAGQNVKLIYLNFTLGSIEKKVKNTFYSL